jgi:hypothetical protein
MASQKNQRLKTRFMNLIFQVRLAVSTLSRAESHIFCPVVSRIDPERIIWHFPRRKEFMKAQVPPNRLKGVGAVSSGIHSSLPPHSSFLATPTEKDRPGHDGNDFHLRSVPVSRHAPTDFVVDTV